MPRYGTHGRVLIADLTTRTHARRGDRRVGLPPVPRRLRPRRLADVEALSRPAPIALAPEACFAIVLGPAHGRAHAVLGADPDRRQVAAHRRRGPTRTRAAAWRASCAARATTRCVVTGRASEPTRARDPRRRGRDRAGRRAVGPGDPAGVRRAARALRRQVARSACRAIGPAGEQQSRIASVMNDRYHAFGRQGFGAIYGAKNLKAIVVHGSGEVPIARPDALPRAICRRDHQRVQARPLLVDAPAGRGWPSRSRWLGFALPR